MKTAIKWLVFLFLSIIIFRAGYSVGVNRGRYKNISREFVAVKNVLKEQSQIPRQWAPGLEKVKIKGSGKIKRQIISVWLPSILISVNILLTAFLAKGKK